MDEDGNLFVEGRASDYSLVNEKQVYNFDIEKAIMRNSNVKLCDVMMNNNLLTAHIVFNNEFLVNSNSDLLTEELIKIQQGIYEEIQDADLVPHSFKIRDSFPYAKSGKRDTLSMKEETEGFILLNSINSEKKKIIFK